MSDTDAWPAEGWTDLGHGCAYRVFTQANIEHAGLVFRHGACIGSVPFVAFGERPTWTLEQLEPLTISPSILCPAETCPEGGIHGHIRNGAWEPC